MTDRSEKKKNVKMMIRSLLISSPVELPLRQLLKDYHSFLGEPLDYRGLGYATPEDFFRDIDDTVMIGWKHGTMTLRAIADETTKHIENLVSKQKKQSKKKRIMYQGREPNLPNMNSRPPRFSKGGLLPPPKIVPAYVRKQIITLFKGYRCGIALENLDDAFIRQFGNRINFSHYGFKSWEEFLNSLKDVISIKEMPNGDWRLLPVEGLYDSNLDKSRKHKAISADEHQPDVGIQNTSPNQETARTRRPSKGRDQSNLKAFEEDKIKVIQKWKFVLERSNPCRRRENSGNSDVTVGSYARSEASSSSNDSEKQRDRLDKLELEIQQVLENRPDGVWASKFPEEFKAKHGKPLDYTRHGYFSVIEFVSNATSVVTIERPTPQGDWKLYDARIPRPQATEDQSRDVRSVRTKNLKILEAETKEAIQRLLKRKSNGIPMKELPAFYKENTGMDIPVKDLGYETSDEYFLSIADSVLQIRYLRGGVLMIYPFDAEIPQFDPSQTAVETPPTTAYATDIVGPGCHYTPVMCPNSDDYTGLFVSNIVNPGLFWVILRRKQNSLALESLMNDIDEFYNSLESQEYTIPESLVAPGQVCATLFPEDNNWHRGVITKINEEGFAAVYFVDYGNTAFVPKKTVKFLKTDFLQLPAQAIQARLANIFPSTGKWKVRSRNRLLELVKERPLIAFVTNVKSQVLSLCLTDTSDPNVDIHINDILVMEGHANFQPDDEVPEIVTKDQHKEVPNYCHVFGWNVKEAPRLPQAAGVNLSQDIQNGNVKKESQEYCYVKWLQLTKDHVIHLINLDGEGYVVSAELSSFIWEEDILSSMLRRSNVEAKKRTVSSDEYPRLFQELTQYNVKSFNAEMLNKRKFISLYEIKSVPDILRTFLEDDSDLVEAVEDLIRKFDPDSPYWKTDESKVMKDTDKSMVEGPQTVAYIEDEVQDLDDAADLSVDEKQMVLQALQFKRKRILQTLMTAPHCSTELVNELNNCETEIMMIKQQSSENSVDKKTQNTEKETETIQIIDDVIKPVGSQLPVQNPEVERNQSAENQRVIQNILNSTTKPIATANIVTKAISSMPQTGTGSNVSNSIPYSLQSNLVTESHTGNYQGMTGTNCSQQQYQGLPSPPMWMPQPGMIPNPRLANMPNFGAMMGTNANISHGMVPFFPQGFPAHMNPMFNAQIPFPSISGSDLSQAQGNMNPVGGVPGLGRGQPMGVLPGLLPLFQNLTVGRGRGGQ